MAGELRREGHDDITIVHVYDDTVTDDMYHLTPLILILIPRVITPELI